MPQLDLLLPFALPPTELAADLRKQARVPALSQLVGRAASITTDAVPDFSRTLAHETVLAQRLGLDVSPHSSPPLAHAYRDAFGLAAAEGVWFILHPVHIHFARDHLVLTDPAQLEIDDATSRALFAIAKPLFDEYGHELIYGGASTWFMRADAWQALATATPAAAAGHNIDLWMPQGEGERAWRKLQNEVQMHWFDHPINAEREIQGQQTINSLWIWGASTQAQSSRFDETLWNCDGWVQRISPSQVQFAADARALINAAAPQSLALLDHLRLPAQAGDWGSWLVALEALEQTWFAPLHTALKSGKIDRLRLIATDDTQVRTLTVHRNSLRKFWRKDSLERLFS